LNANVPKPVVIYGWHQLNGQPIQPVYNGHGETYADYSHGIRLVLDSVLVDGVAKTFLQLLADPVFSVLISDEGVITKPYYTLSGNVTPTPKSFGLIWNGSNSLKISASPTSGTTFKAFYGNDGVYFNDSTSEFSDHLILNGLQNDSIFFFRLRANSTSGYSLFTEVLAAVPSSTSPHVLIVNGFDRASSGNTYNFIRQHGKAFLQNGYSFSSSTNDAVWGGLISLQNFSIVDYILGDESTADETFSAVEQETIKLFLRNGGKLFVSGAEIAWDLDYKGSTSDKEFILNFLKSQYLNDAPSGQAGVYYQAEAVIGTVFDGIGSVNFDNGTQGTINVRYPDVITGINGGANGLKYSNLTNQFAGVYYEGIFSGGSTPGKVVCLGFPFETIYPESKRQLFLEKVISFFNRPVEVKDDKSVPVNSFKLYQNFPNPFNPSTTLSFSLSQPDFVTLKIFDILGSEVATILDNDWKETGLHNVQFSISNSQLPSGVYIYRITSGNFSAIKKLILIR
jgi:hypothetical protein